MLPSIFRVNFRERLADYQGLVLQDLRCFLVRGSVFETDWLRPGLLPLFRALKLVFDVEERVQTEGVFRFLPVPRKTQE